MLLGLVVLSLLSIGVLSFSKLRPVHAATIIVVNSTEDDQDNDGECTLREAIIASNSDTASGAATGECESGSGNDTINFSISGGADFTNGGEDGYTIELTNSLPLVTETVIINGYSQPGSQVNTATSPNPFNGTLLIEIDGLGQEYSAIQLVAGSDNSIVSGLVINNMQGIGVNFYGTNYSTLTGSYIGTDPTGLIAKSMGSDSASSSTAVSAGILDAPNVDTSTSEITVGGLSPNDRNIISGNLGGAISILATDITVQGNYIGLGSNGVTLLGNSLGADVETGNITVDYANHVLIGGTSPGSSNVISGAGTSGISPVATKNIAIQGNYIGTDYTGTIDKPNSGDGITFFQSPNSNAIVGGDSPQARNIINSNGQQGIGINQSSGIVIRGNDISSNSVSGVSGVSAVVEANDIQIVDNTISSNGNDGIALQGSPTEVTIIENSIFSNIDQGIDLGGDGVTANDELDVDTGPNDYLNFPVIDFSYESNTSTIAEYTLDIPSGNYRIELFSNSGETFLGSQNISSNGTGNESHYITVPGTGYADLVMTGTEIDESSDGYGATSEFGPTASNLTESDITTTIQVVDNNEPVDDNMIRYRTTITNNGPAGIDLANYDGSFGNPAIGSLSIMLPPELTFISDDSSDISCTLFGNAGSFGPAFANHTSYNIFACPWTGASQILKSGESYSIVLTASVENPTLANFTSFAFMLAEFNDPDFTEIGEAYTSGNDIIDELIDRSINNYSQVSWPLSGDEDSDDDGILDNIENASPNGGDGNGDGTIDSAQASVTSIPDATGKNYITLALDKGGVCTQISEFVVTSESDQTVEDTEHDYPLGMNRFSIPCSYSVFGSIYYHGLNTLTDYTYRKFGPTTPGVPSSSSWYDADFTYASDNIGASVVAKASFDLRDGVRGDDTAKDGIIVDDNGPGLVTTDPKSITSIINLANTGQDMRLFGLFGLFLAVSAIYLAKRTRNYTQTSGR